MGLEPESLHDFLLIGQVDIELFKVVQFDMPFQDEIASLVIFVVANVIHDLS